ncbi:MAG: hypothetical protein QXK84_07435, partial [Nitrososphaerota archaeon]
MKSIGKSEYLNSRVGVAVSPRTPSPGAEPESAGVLERLQQIPHARQMNFRMGVVSLLRLAKEWFTYRELSRMLRLQQTVLNRYVKGHVIPSFPRCVVMLERLRPILSLREFVSRLSIKPDRPIDVSHLIGNPAVLNLTALECMMEFAEDRITRV